MDYNDFALFARVVEGGSFTAAARALRLPKSSVTRGIARLERELGVRLIQRTTRQRGVTDAGRELYERVRGAVTALDEAAETTREHGREPAGIVRVTANPDVAHMGVAEALAELRAKLPRVQLELILTSRIVDLVAESVDLAIRAGPLGDSTLVARKVGITNAGLFASKAYLKKRGRPAKLADVAEHDCVVFRARQGRGSWTLTGPRGPQTVDVAAVVSVDDFMFLAEAIAAGLGIGPLPLFIAHDRGGLERVLPELSIPGGQLHVVMPSASYVPARVAAVRDFLVERLAKTLTSCG